MNIKAALVERLSADAGVLAADRLRKLLAGRYDERAEIALSVVGLGGFERARRLIAAMRGLPGVVAVSLDALSDRDAKLRVFVERLSADELAASLLRLGKYSFTVRSVEADFNAVELEGGEEAL